VNKYFGSPFPGIVFLVAPKLLNFIFLQEKKRALVKSLIATEAGFFKSLTTDDVKALFS